MPKRSRSDNAVPHKAKVLGGGHPPWMNDEKICSTEVGLLTDYPWLWVGERETETEGRERQTERREGGSLLEFLIKILYSHISLD